jgi:hypothetical protein
MPSETPKQVWIGLAEVTQRPGAGVLMDRNGAYVNVLALAASASEFHQTAEAALTKLGFQMVELEDSEPIDKKLEGAEGGVELLALAREVEASGEPRFGPFHTWTSDEG